MSDEKWLAGSSDPHEIELRRALDQAADVQLDDVASRRLWARIAEPEMVMPPQRSPRRRRPWPRRPWPRIAWWGFMGGVAATTAVAIIILVGTGMDHRRGQATSSPSQQSAASAVRSLEIGPAMVRTGPDQSMRVRLARSAEASIGPASRLSVDRSAMPVLEDGEARFVVQPQPAGRQFVVIAGPYRIVVVGTKFHLSVKGERVGVLVEEGRVEVWQAERVLARLGHGDVWSSASLPEASSTAAAPMIAAAPAAAPATEGARRHLAMRDTAAFAVAPRQPPATGEARGVDSSPGEAPARAAVPAPAEADRAGEARAALAAGDPRRALELYRAMARQGGAASENAEYEVGRILRDKLGQPREAVAVWRSYLQDHPAGLLRSEANLSIVDTLVLLGDGDAALAEAKAFLAGFPDSERRAEVARVAGDIYRSKGNCRAAVEVYGVALSAPRPRSVTDHVTFHRAACLLALGDGSGRDVLNEYLEQFPAGHYRDDANRLLQSVSGGAAPRR